MIPEGFKPANFTGRFLAHNGPFYTCRDGDAYLVGLEITEDHINYIDMAHGGVISMLADVALSMQVYLSERPNPSVTTTSLTVNFLAAANLGDWLVVESTIDRLGKRTAHVHGAIKRGDDVLATASGVFAIYRPPAR